MSILNSKFDILRGWPNSSAVAEDFVIGAPTNDPLVTGAWVRLSFANPATGYVPLDTVKANKDAALATGAAHANIASPELWCLVIEGRDEYSAQAAGRITCLLGGGYIVRLWNDPDTAANDMFVSANMAPGRMVTIAGGKVVDAGLATGADYTALIKQPIGYCLRNDDTANYTVDIYVNL
jgi:hypothetical protein